MKVKILTFLGVILALNLMIASLVFSDSVFIVMGTVKNPDGSPVNKGLQVTVTNETKNLTVETTVDNKETGGYNAVFIDLENKSVAENGDTIKVIVKDNQTSIATQTYKLTADDIAKTRAIISVTTSTPEECFKGDINGDNAVKSNDAILALRISSDLISPTPQQLCAGDMNSDGKIKSNDAILILRKVV
ncbi:MAG: Dockerin protein, partial [Candidatus Poribacteria bacterium]|nr:Dockerin protein [Candidatus Poribacteria bacterium]